MSIFSFGRGKMGLIITAVSAVILFASTCVSAGESMTTTKIKTSSFYLDVTKKYGNYSSLTKMLDGRVGVYLENYGADPSVVQEWESLVSQSTISVPFRLSGFDFGVNNPSKEQLKSVLVSRGTYFSRYAARRSELAQIAKVLSYKVVQGDTVDAIAKQFNITATTILLVNGLTAKSTLKEGKILYFPSVSGVVHTVVKGDTVSGISKLYGISSANIIKVNGLKSPYTLNLKQKLVIPGATKLPTVSAAKDTRTSTTSRSTLTLGTTFSYPVGGVLTSKFGTRWGRMHEGVDFGVPIGTTVRASSSGKVTFAGWQSAYGYLVTIQHANNTETWYAHNSSLLVSVGDYVNKGDVIAKSGATGRVTGPHVHFEIRVNGKAVNPLNYLK